MSLEREGGEEGGRPDALVDMPPKQVNTCPPPAASGSVLETPFHTDEIGHRRAWHLELSNPDLLKLEQKVFAFPDLCVSHVHWKKTIPGQGARSWGRRPPRPVSSVGGRHWAPFGPGGKAAPLQLLTQWPRDAPLGGISTCSGLGIQSQQTLGSVLEGITSSKPGLMVF